MSLDMTSFDAALKQHYTADKVEDMVYSDNPFFAMVKKNENFGGRNMPIVLVYGNPQGRSKTFSNAQTRGTATSSKVVDFLLTRVKDYSFATIDNETLEASKGDKNAFMTAATTEIDGAINALTRSIAISMYGNASGSLGQVLAEPTEEATFTVTLKVESDVTNFEVGQILVAYAAESGGSAKIAETGNADFEISAIDRSAGTITFTDTYDTNGTIAANDYLFVEGDRGLSLSGLDSWIPSSSPTSGDSFFGVDRSADVTRLAGNISDGSAKPIEEALIDAATQAAREGGKPDVCFLSYAKYGELEKALGSKAQYVDTKVSAEIGFRGILINGPRGSIKVIPDQNCQEGTAWMLQLSTWKLCSLGKAIRVIDTDGLQMLRQASADGVECRYGSYSQLGCSAPGFNTRVTLD